MVRLTSLGGGGDAAAGGSSEGGGNKLITRTPSQASLSAVAEFARKTGDYPQLSGVDLQILALVYELEVEAANTFGNDLGYVRREPKRVLGVNVKALVGDGKRSVKSVAGSASSVSGSVSGGASEAGTSVQTSNTNSMHAFFQGNADGIIDASNVDLEYDDDEEEEYDGDEMRDDSVMGSSTAASAASTQPKKSSWALMVNPTAASTAPILDYSLATSGGTVDMKMMEEEEQGEAILSSNDVIPIDGQFDDASESDESEGDDTFSSGDEDDDEARALAIANAEGDVDMSDEECDVFVLDPHEVVYYKKLREQKKSQTKSSQKQNGQQDDDGLESEFPSLAIAATVPYEGSDDEGDYSKSNEKTAQLESNENWEQEEEERKKKSLEPMVNGRRVQSTKYNSFRKYGNIVSASGAAVAMKKLKEEEDSKIASTDSTAATSVVVDKQAEIGVAEDNNGYKSRIIGGGAAALAADTPAEMTADDDDGEGWVTCTRDIQTIKSTGSLHLSHSRHNSNNKSGNPQYQPKKYTGPPLCQRAACATTDFAMQNVLLQMNLELLTVDGVRVRRLKTWVTRCAACFTIYGTGDDKKGKSGGRLFCDKCGSNTLQRIAASVDRNTGRLKLHMRKNYQNNLRGTKFSLPKAGKGNKYEGDLLLAEDQLMYGAWAQKVKKGKSKSLGQSMFGSDLASDLGCHTDLTKRDDIRVGFGRRNPNSTKFGRERRGKKKKGTTDKACGLRRY